MMNLNGLISFLSGSKSIRNLSLYLQNLGKTQDALCDTTGIDALVHILSTLSATMYVMLEKFYFRFVVLLT